MSPDTAHVLPSKRKDFLSEVDQLLGAAVEMHCLGGFVLSALYDLPQPTGDVDYIAAMCKATEDREFRFLAADIRLSVPEDDEWNSPHQVSGLLQLGILQTRRLQNGYAGIGIFPQR